MTTLNWMSNRIMQGQMVTEQHPQISGAAEGQEGQAEGLRVVYDQSNGEWVLYADQKLTAVVARVNRLSGHVWPSVEEAMRLRSRYRAVARPRLPSADV